MIRMSLGEMLIDLALWLMPRGHPHRQAWIEGRNRAERLLESSP
jgi:hypothetical protein